MYTSPFSDLRSHLDQEDMKYSEGRALFEAAWQDTSSWSARIHDAIFKSISNIAQDQRLVKFRTECIANSAKLWEIRTYGDRYFGIVSSEKKVSVIVEGNEDHHISMHVDDVVTSIAIDFQANMFHIFIGQRSGKIIHTRLNPTGVEFVFEPVTFDLPVTSGPILHIVPNTYRQVVFPDKFWVITHSAITLHRYDHPYVKSLAEYSAPSADLLNVEYQHPLLAVHYLSKDNAIISVMIHVFATHFYAEVRFIYNFVFLSLLRLRFGWNREGEF